MKSESQFIKRIVFSYGIFAVSWCQLIGKIFCVKLIKKFSNEFSSKWKKENWARDEWDRQLESTQDLRALKFVSDCRERVLTNLILAGKNYKSWEVFKKNFRIKSFFLLRRRKEFSNLHSKFSYRNYVFFGWKSSYLFALLSCQLMSSHICFRMRFR